MAKTLDCQLMGIRHPKDIITIFWEVCGASGNTQCEAWLGQYEIESLEKAGYKVYDAALHSRFTG